MKSNDAKTDILDVAITHAHKVQDLKRRGCMMSGYDNIDVNYSQMRIYAAS